MTARDPKELAEQAGVEESYVARLVELGIVTPSDDGTFSDGDVNRVRFVHASDRGGLSLEAIARPSRYIFPSRRVIDMTEQEGSV